MRAIGLMSGTSMDGIDVAMIETDGGTASQFGPSAVHAYQEQEVALLLEDPVHPLDGRARWRQRLHCRRGASGLV